MSFCKNILGLALIISSPLWAQTTPATHSNRITKEEFLKISHEKFNSIHKPKKDKIKLSDCGKNLKWCKTADTNKDGYIDVKEFIQQSGSDFDDADKTNIKSLERDEGLKVFKW